MQPVLRLVSAWLVTVAAMLNPTTTTRWCLSALLATGLLAACGDDGAGTEASGDSSTEDRRDAALEYAQCMREHGVDMPDPEISADGETQIQISPGDSDMTREDMDAAEEACEPIMDEVVPEEERDISPEELAERQDQAVELAECMRERGHDFPDPEVDENGGMRVGGGPGTRPGDPGADEFEADLEECHEEAGMEGPGDGGSLSTSGEGEA